MQVVMQRQRCMSCMSSCAATVRPVSVQPPEAHSGRRLAKVDPHQQQTHVCAAAGGAVGGRKQVVVHQLGAGAQAAARDGGAVVV